MARWHAFSQATGLAFGAQLGVVGTGSLSIEGSWRKVPIELHVTLRRGGHQDITVLRMTAPHRTSATYQVTTAVRSGGGAKRGILFGENVILMTISSSRFSRVHRTREQTQRWT